MAPADPAFASVKYLPTNEAYDRWAKVYDTDGNFLQAMDNIEMQDLFPRFLASINTQKPWRLVDLGCGTGRNTTLLTTVPNSHIVALDSSPGMLEVAKSRLIEIDSEADSTTIDFEVFDLLVAPGPPTKAEHADGVISTLVIEHIPLAAFFFQVSKILKTGGVLLLTNMHSEMGGISQAGFVDTDTGEKIRPVSYAHTVTDVLAEAAKWGLEVEGETGILERAVTGDMVSNLGPRSSKWVGVTCWFGGLLRKTSK